MASPFKEQQVGRKGVSNSFLRNVVNFLAFLIPIPLFLLPNYPFFFIHFVDIGIGWIGLPPHPEYTGSLGLAAPIGLASVALIFCSFWTKETKPIFQALEIRYLTIVILFFILLLLVQALPLLGFIASYFSVYLLTIIPRDKLSKQIATPYFLGVLLFVLLHFISIIFNGIETSIRTDAFTIFGLEIYQALISYTAVLSFLAGTILLKPEFFDAYFNRIAPSIDGKWVRLVCFVSMVAVIVSMGRRLSFLVICFSLLLYLVSIFDPKKKLRYLLAALLGMIAIIVFASKQYIGVESINFLNMVKPRIGVYIDIVTTILDGDFLDLVIGIGSGWAEKHNFPLDVIFNSGLIGLTAVSFLFYLLITNIKRNKMVANAFDGKNNKIYTIFFVCVLVGDNLVNINFNLPYYTINVFLIYTIVLNSPYALSKHELEG